MTLICAHASLSHPFAPSGRAVPFHHCPLLPEGDPWDGHAARRRLRKWATRDGRVDWKRYELGFTCVAGPPGEAACRLPHHDVRDGTLVTSWRGVAAAMAVLLGAHGGLRMPEAERRSAYQHLVRHYAEFGKTPPPFRQVGVG